MTNYSENDNALQLSDDDVVQIGDHELGYDSTKDEWVAEQQVPTGGPTGNHAKGGEEYVTDAQEGRYSMDFSRTGPAKAPYQHDGSDITIGAFARVDNTDDGYRGVIGRFGGNRRLYIVSAKGDGTPNWGYGYGDTFIETSESVSFGQWVHVALSFSTSDDTVRFYLDGVEIDTNVNSWPSGNTAEDFALGGLFDNHKLDQTMDGRLDDVRIYDRQLPQTEINDWSNSNPPSNGLDAHWSFEYPESENTVIDATGDPYPRKNVPRSAGGSAVPTGLANAVSAGEVLADDGNIYSTVQGAVDNATGWVFVGPGTFNEAVTVSTAGMTIEGSGYGTHIDGGTTGDAINLSAANVTIQNLSVSTTGGGGNNYVGVNLDGSANSTVNSVVVRDSDNHGIELSNSPDSIVTDCNIESCDSAAVAIQNSSVRSIVSDCYMGSNVTGEGVFVADQDCIITNNITDSVGDIGVELTSGSSDTVAGGNRIIGSGNDGFFVNSNSNDNIVFNNRISDSVNADFDQNSGSTVLDGNLTGASN